MEINATQATVCLVFSSWGAPAQNIGLQMQNPKSRQTTSCLARGKEPLKVLEGAAGVRCVKVALIPAGFVALEDCLSMPAYSASPFVVFQVPPSGKRLVGSRGREVGSWINNPSGLQI